MTRTPKAKVMKTCRTVALDAQNLLDVLETEKQAMAPFRFPDNLTIAVLKLEKSLRDLR